MTLSSNEKWYRITVSIVLGLIGFWVNFHTLKFPLGEYTVAVLVGLLFPLLIALSWGWKYGMLSALVGGSQSMWWVWGPSNGYALFLIVPPFTLWIIWHGIFAVLRSRQAVPQWWMNMYVVEIPFRILATVNLYTLTRWAISFNPPPWGWAADSATAIPLHFTTFFAVKQGICAYIVLIMADVVLNIRLVRRFFRLSDSDYRKTSYVIGVFLLLGCLFWLLDSFFHAFAFQEKKSFYELLALDIPSHNLFTRLVFFLFCIIAGLVTANILRRQKAGERSLQRAEQEAVTREGFLRALITTIPDLVWLKDPKGVYLACNPRFERMFGAEEKEIIGKTDYDFVDKNLADFFRKHDKKAMDNGISQTNQEEVVFADDGHRELLETTKTPMYDNDGDLIGVLGIGRNVTERINLQAQLSQAQKMESVGRLAGGVAHDYNNLSSIIIGYSELALDKVEANDPLHADLTEILAAGRRSTAVTRQLLAFARQQTVAPVVLDLNDTIENTLKMLRRLIGEDIHLSWLPGTRGWSVKIDPSQVDQILANLCVNARDAITDVGKISIETDNAFFDEDYCVAHAGFIPGEYVLLAVSDDGCGIAPEIREKVFEPFFTTKNLGQGTGLGLATVYGIVKQNKGFVNVYSEVGEGTTIKIYLPRHLGPPAKAYQESSPEFRTGDGETVLLVEDDATILKIGERILLDLGYNVISTTSPNQAVRLAEAHKDELRLLLTDVVMPEMNGRDLSEKLQAIIPGLKILFTSGYTADVIAHRGVLDDDVNFISKPFSKKKVAFLIRELLDGAGT